MICPLLTYRCVHYKSVTTFNQLLCGFYRLLKQILSVHIDFQKALSELVQIQCMFSWLYSTYFFFL